MRFMKKLALVMPCPAANRHPCAAMPSVPGALSAWTDFYQKESPISTIIMADFLHQLNSAYRLNYNFTDNGCIG